MLSIKSGVQLRGLRPEMLVALNIVEAVYSEAGYAVTITSGTEGKHSWGSLHYQGSALDFRTRHIDTREEKRTISQEIRERLSQEFGVILEDTHLHIEFQPKEE